MGLSLYCVFTREGMSALGYGMNPHTCSYNHRDNLSVSHEYKGGSGFFPLSEV